MKHILLTAMAAAVAVAALSTTASAGIYPDRCCGCLCPWILN